MKREIANGGEKINKEIENFYQRWTTLKPKQTTELNRESARETVT
jgi:hypothetical protein